MGKRSEGRLIDTFKSDLPLSRSTFSENALVPFIVNPILKITNFYKLKVFLNWRF